MTGPGVRKALPPWVRLAQALRLSLIAPFQMAEHPERALQGCWPSLQVTKTPLRAVDRAQGRDRLSCLLHAEDE